MPQRLIRPGTVALAAAVSGLLAAVPAHAQNAAAAPADAPNPLEQRVHELEDTVKQLQDQLKQIQQQKAIGTPGAPGAAGANGARTDQKPAAGWDANGFFVQSADGANILRIRGYLQNDFRAATSGNGRLTNDNFYLRRVRPIFDGTVAKYFDFRIMPDFGLGATVLQDAYIDYHYNPQARIRAGKFKVPFSVERLQSATDIAFVERSIVNSLAPVRDVGAQLYGDTLGGVLSYALAGFNGGGDGTTLDGDTGNDKDFAGRIFVQPFKNQAKSPLQGLGLGVAATIGGRNEEAPGANYRTASRSTFFRYGSSVLETGTHVRVAPQAYYYNGPFSFMGEYIRSSQDLLKGDVQARTTNTGWFAQVSYVLTGEKASYRGVVPRKPFDPSKGQWGAVELAARYSKVNIDGDTFALGFADPATATSGAREWTFGVNWYLNRNLKLQGNYVRTDFDDVLDFGPTFLQHNHENIFLTRLQVSF